MRRATSPVSMYSAIRPSQRAHRALTGAGCASPYGESVPRKVAREFPLTDPRTTERIGRDDLLGRRLQLEMWVESSELSKNRAGIEKTVLSEVVAPGLNVFRRQLRAAGSELPEQIGQLAAESVHTPTEPLIVLRATQGVPP